MAFPTPDASTPVFLASTSATPASRSFSPPAGSVVFVSLINGGDGTLANTVTDTSGATWARVPNSSHSDTSFGLGVETWYASFTTAPGSTVATAHYTTSNYVDVQPIVLPGAATTQTGNASIVKAPGTGTLVSAAFTTTAAGSAGLWVGYLDSSVAPTPGTNQTITFGGTSSFDNTSGHNSWTQLLTTAAGALGSTITMNTTAPTLSGTPPWEGVAVEILAATASPKVLRGRVISQAATRASTY